MVFGGFIPLQLAVTVFAVGTVLSCTFGIMALLIFPGSGLNVGVYSSESREARAILFVLDVAGLYFGFLGLYALRDRDAKYLMHFFLYELARLCLHVPILALHLIVSNTCNIYVAGVTGISIRPRNAPINVTCSQQHFLYLCFTALFFVAQGYMCNLAYWLVQKYGEPMAHARFASQYFIDPSKV